MKKILAGLAFLGAATGLAHAQTNMAVYGIIDTGYIKVEGSDTRMGHNYSSRIGFRGSEDLGSGHRATFEIEKRLDLNNGGNGTLPDYDDQVHGRPRGETQYQGASNVGLAGFFGHFRFGRMNAPGIESYRALDPFFFVGSGRSLGYETRLYSEQITNTVRYDSPVIDGFSASLTYSLEADDDDVLTSALPGSPPTDARQNHGYAMLLKYDRGPLMMMGHASRLADSNQSWYWSAGASYRFGPALVGLGYQDVKDKANFAGYDVTNRTWMVTLQYFIGQGIIKAAYNHGRISDWGDNDGSASKYVLGYTHNLSKLVSAYVIASYTDSDNRAVGGQFNPNYLQRESASAFQVGMTYRF
jgi:predicted porin